MLLRVIIRKTPPGPDGLAPLDDASDANLLSVGSSKRLSAQLSPEGSIGQPINHSEDDGMSVLLTAVDREILRQLLSDRARLEVDLRVGAVSLLDQDRLVFDDLGFEPTLTARVKQGRSAVEAALVIPPAPSHEHRLSVRLADDGVLIMALNGVDWLTIAVEPERPYTPHGEMLLACGDGAVSQCRSTAGLTTLSVLLDQSLTSCALPPGNGRLAHITFRGCHALTDVSALVDYPGLTHLDISWCRSLVDVTPLSALANLTDLNLAGCESIAKVGLAGLTKLTRLNLFCCTKLASVHLSDLGNLVELNLECCGTLTHLELSRLDTLTHLDLSWCRALDSLTPLSTLLGLTHLTLAGCSGLTNLAPLYHLAQLRQLSLAACPDLTSLEPLSRLHGLTDLDLAGCTALANLEPLSGLSRLEHLNLTGCTSLGDLRPLSKLSGLTDLSLAGCTSLTDLAPLAALRQLIRLDLTQCRSVGNLEFLSALPRLRCLDLADCTSVVSLVPLSGTTGLTRLSLARSGGVVNLTPLSNLSELVQLDLTDARALASVGPLARLTGLVDLNLSGCQSVSSLEPLAGLHGLIQLDLSGCRSVTSLAPLATLNALTQLNLAGCASLTNLEPLSGLTELTDLDLAGCASLTSLEPLAALPGLARLNLAGCQSLTDMSPLSALKGLVRLNLDECKSMTSLALYGLDQLAGLSLRGCESLRELDLEGLSALSHLHPSRCDALAKVSLSGLTSLRRLDLSQRQALESLILTELTALTELSLKRNESLHQFWLSDLNALDALSLAGCRALQGILIEQWSELPSLTQLDLSHCEILSDTVPFAKLTALRELSLAGWTSLTQVAPLAALPALTRLDLTGCAAIQDLDSLAALRSLHDLRFEIDPPAVAAVLMACAAQRGDLAQIRASWRDWLARLQYSKTPSQLAQRLMDVLATLVASTEPASSTHDLRQSLLELLRAMRARGAIEPAVWQAALELALRLGDPELRLPFEWVETMLDPMTDDNQLLRPWLDCLARVPASARDWALALADQLLSKIQEDARARELAPMVCLFYARQQGEEQVRAWLGRATRHDLGTWHDRVQLALLDWDLERQDQGAAIDRLHRITSATIRNLGWERLALALAERSPADAMRALAAITDQARQARLAWRLVERPGFATGLGADHGLLLATQDDPSALVEMLLTLAQRETDTRLVDELSQQLGPPPNRLAELAGLVRETLAHTAIVDALGQNRIERFTERTLADSERLAEIVRRGLVETLQAEGDLAREDVEAVRQQVLGMDAGVLRT